MYKIIFFTWSLLWSSIIAAIEGMPVNDSLDGRKEQRTRELAIQGIVQASAQAQIYRERKSSNSCRSG